jgi:hypothetical protein
MSGFGAFETCRPMLPMSLHAGVPKSKAQFSVAGGFRPYLSVKASRFQSIIVALPMSNASVKVAIALFMVLTPPAASFARGGGHGGGHAGAAMGAFARPAGSAGMGNVPISGVPRGPANAGGLNNSRVDPSGANTGRLATLPQAQISAPAPLDRAVPPAMNVEPQTMGMGEISGGHRQPRADQVRSQRSLTNQYRADNRENAAVDSKLDICRGC